MSISATVIADSVAPHGMRITTMQLRYPRAIHAEFMTHRQFSRNASSSRAIPVERLIQDVLDDPFVPKHWGKNQKGMQAGEAHDAVVVVPVVAPSKSLPALRGVFGDSELFREGAWIAARDRAVEIARGFAKAGYHKQIVNRLLEPFAHISVVVTSTEWDNFFALRRHPDAEPHMQDLAQAMWEARESSFATWLKPGEWHLPYTTNEDWNEFPPDLVTGGDGYSWEEALDGVIKISVARCASVSYQTVEGLPMRAGRAAELYDKLLAATPIHASPAEHQAVPDTVQPQGSWDFPEQHGNFVGWRQYRKMLPNECVRTA